MKKKYMKLIKIFLALVVAFSQLSNAAVVFADELDDNDLDTSVVHVSTVIKADEKEDTTLINEEENNEEDKEHDIDTSVETNSEEGDDSGDGNLPSDGDFKETDEVERDFTIEDLEEMMDSYLNGTQLSEEIINLLIKKNAPSIVNGEFTFISLEDIMFVNELLKVDSDTETEREENVNLSLELGEIPEKVVTGRTFEVQVLVSNSISEEILDDVTDDENVITDELEEISKDFIDGIEGLINTNDKLHLKNIEYTKFTGSMSNKGEFVAAGEEYGEDKGVLLTLTFEALNEGVGEVTISGSLAKYLTIVSFEELYFSIDVVSPTGLSSLSSSVGEFDSEFDSEKTEYILTVPAGTTEVTFDGTLVNGNGKVVGLSTYVLDEDETIVTITVTLEDDSQKVYTVKIVREAEVIEELNDDYAIVEEISAASETPVVAPIVYVYSSNNYLKSLNIKDYDINFEKGIFEYKLKVGADVKFLDITAIAEDYRSRVEINDNEDFKEGENVVTIRVTAENGEVREYKLLVEKEAKSADKALEEAKDSSGKAEKIVIIVLIVLVVLGLLYLIFKKDDENSNSNQDNKMSNNNKKSKER